MYRKGQPTATSILIYEDSRGEVVQQCIANLMSTFHLYPHSEVIAISFTDQFEDLLRWLHKTDKPNRDTCKNWRAWSREKFVEYLRLLYPQLSNAADKSYLEMIKESPSQYDLDNPVLELKFQSELSNKHYDSLTIAEEAEAVKILLENINIPNVYNWIPIFNEMATGCDVSIPVTTVDVTGHRMFRGCSTLTRSHDFISLGCKRHSRDPSWGHQGCLVQREKSW